jgi:N-acetylneuraminic acid mutarotase
MMPVCKPLLALWALLAMFSASSVRASFDWRPLPSLPDKEGFAGSFTGVSRDTLLVAGGSNFPGKRPWEGGTKVWYDRVFMLAPGARVWRDAGRLPCANGYGVSVSLAEGLVLAGGGDATRNFGEVWLACWNGRSLDFTALPSLPLPLAQSAGALVGRTLYLAGGLDRPDAKQAQRGLYALDFDRLSEGWKKLEDCPGPERILATAAGNAGVFYLFGGARLVTDAQGATQREWLRDAWCYQPGAGWKRLADLPRPAVAAPTPAPVIDGRMFVLGGDDGSQVSVSPMEHRGFPRGVLAYDPTSNTWTCVAELPFSLVTTSSATWQGLIVVPGGEAKPGRRSPAVWAAPAN